MTYKVVIQGKNYNNHPAPGWNDRISASARHFQQGGKMERDFLWVCIEAIRRQLKGVVLKPYVYITYVFFETDMRRDLGNIAFIDKPFCDALQQCKVLANDNRQYIKKLTFIDGEIDKENPRIEIYIEDQVLKI